MDGDTTFGVWLKRRRRQLDLTQKGLAHQVGCSVGTIRKMEADERRPSRQLAALLTQHLEIPSDQQEAFIAFARAEPYISDVSFPVPSPVEDPIPVIPQKDSVQSIKNNLPLAATPFIGRETELATLDDLLINPGVRLVTILGPGGIGKTRLALAYARQLVGTPPRTAARHHYPHGVFFVDLAPLAEAERLVSLLAEVLTLRIQGGAREKRSSKQQLLDHLCDRRLLLVLDNFEHLLSPADSPEKQIGADGAALVAEILQAALDIRILVTSRERLNLQMEQVFAIDGLTFPDWRTATPEVGNEDVDAYTAVQLFFQTARRNQQSFSMENQDERLALVRICQLLDGMPLGVELAAAWVDVLSLVDIAAEIQQSLDFLETEMRNLPVRHRSIRATFDYSWRKLDAKEQSVFKQLSIFRGGFTRQAAEVVTGVTPRQISWLVNKSFIQFNKSRNRYQVHELLRQYGAERLGRDSELERGLRDRHSTYYCQILANHTDDLKGPGQAQAISAIEVDIGNVRLAWNHAITHQDLEAISISLESLFRFCLNNGWWMQGVKEFEKAVAVLRTGEPIGLRGIVLGRLLAWLGFLYNFTGQSGNQMEVAIESLDLLQRLGAWKETYVPLMILALGEESPKESYQLLQESLTLAREAGDQWAIADALFRMGVKSRAAGNFEQAEQRWQEALQQMRHNGDRIGTAEFLGRLSILAGDCGRYQESLSLARESMSLSLEFNMPLMHLDALGLALYNLGRYQEAEEPLKQGLALVRDLGLQSFTLECLFYLGKVAFCMGDYVRAQGQFQGSLTIALEFEDLEWVAQNHDALGRLNLTQGDKMKAREHLQVALQNAIPLGRPPILLANMASIAELFVEDGNSEYAALLATFIANHPVSQAKVKERAYRLRTRLEGQIPPEELEMIRQRSRKSDLDTLVAQLVIDLGR